MYYYFGYIITDRDINFDNIQLDEKLFIIYDISYKTSIIQKPLRIRFDKIDIFIRLCVSEFKHLILFVYGLFDKICDKIKHSISEKSAITDSVNHSFRKIRIDSYNSLHIEKMLTSHNIVILIKSVVNKNKYITTTIIYFQKKDCIKINECLNECLYIINAIFRQN